MTEHSRRATADGDVAVLRSGPWNLELIQPRSEVWRHWLGTRPGRLLHLELGLDEPGTVPGAVPLGGGRYEVPPEHNLGTRLILSPHPTAQARADSPSVGAPTGTAR